MIEKVKEVFSKDYRDDVSYREFMAQNINLFKLNNSSEKVEDIINRLNKLGFESNYVVSLGDFE